MIILAATFISEKLLAISNCTDPRTCDTTLPEIQASPDNVQKILQLLFGVIGAIAMIWIIIAGIQLTTSQGDPQSAARARQTIIYAVIGLVITLSAEAIVTFVLGRIG